LFAEGVELLAPGGRFVQIGAARGTAEGISPASLFRGKRIIGNLMYRSEVLPMLLSFLAKNHQRLPFDKIISHRYALADINTAFQDADWQARETQVTRAVIVP
jgi:Zn-dependent alcohol dehydrogenase